MMDDQRSFSAPMQNTVLADIVIIGAGASGLAAACEAATLGMKVILLEKAARTGGMMNWCVGTVSAANTPQQRRMGIRDNADDHFEDLGTHAGPLASRDNLKLRRLLVDHGSEMMQWLLDLGIVFAEPMIDPPQRVARMHNVVPSARSFAYHMEKACRQRGVDIWLDTACERLVMDNGSVVGVEARTGNGLTRTVRANKGVILATGDYSGSAELLRSFGVPELASVDPVAATSTGDGYRFGLEAGSEVLNGDIVRGPIMRFVPPPQQSLVQRIPPLRSLGHAVRLAMRITPQRIMRPFMMKFLTTVLGPSPTLFAEGAMLVDRHGERLPGPPREFAAAVVERPGKEAYIVFDGALAEKFSAWPYFISTAPGIAYAYLDDYRRCRQDIFHSAQSVAELADLLQMSREALSQAFLSEGSTARQPPFFALGPVRSYVVFTEGGLRINEQHEVLRRDGAVVPGLRAVGSVGQGGVLLEGHGHHLAWAFISGRLAARSCAA